LLAIGCFLSGFSERLVPELLMRFEKGLTSATTEDTTA